MSLSPGCLQPHPMSAVLKPGELIIGIDAPRDGRAAAFAHRKLRIGVAPSNGHVLIAAIIGNEVQVCQFWQHGVNLLKAPDMVAAKRAPKLTAVLLSEGRVSDVMALRTRPKFWEVFGGLLRGQMRGVSELTGDTDTWAFRFEGEVCLDDGEFREV